MYSRSTNPKEYRIPSHYSGVAFGKNERQKAEMSYAHAPTPQPIPEKTRLSPIVTPKIEQSPPKKDHESSEEKRVLKAEENMKPNVQTVNTDTSFTKKKRENPSSDDLLIASLLLLIMGNDGDDDMMLILLLFILLFSDRDA